MTLAYNHFACQDYKRSSSIITKEYKAAIKKFNESAKLIPNSKIDEMKDLYSLLNKTSNAELESIEDTNLYDGCANIINLVDSLESIVGSENLNKSINKENLVQIEQCKSHKKLFESILKYKDDSIMIKQCLNLEFNTPSDVFFALNICKNMATIYIDHQQEIGLLSINYLQMIERNNSQNEQVTISPSSEIDAVHSFLTKFSGITSAEHSSFEWTK